MTNRRWHTELFRKIVQETVKQLMNYEDFAVQKAERARRWRSELSTQRRKVNPTVSQLMVQIQDLQDKVNSLTVQKNSHVLKSTYPSQPVSIPSPRGMINRDSCLQPASRHSFGYIRIRFPRSTCSRRTAISVLRKLEEFGIGISQICVN